MKLVRRSALVLVALGLVGATPAAPEVKVTPHKVRPMLQRLRPAVTPKKLARPAKTPTPALPPCLGMGVLPTKAGARPFAIGEELSYELSVAGAYLGRFETKVGEPRKMGGRTLIPLFGRARTNSFVSTVQPFAGRYMAMVDPGTLRPVGLRVEATFGTDDRWEKVRFSDDLERATVDFRLRGHERKREWKTDHELTDLLSMLYAARSVRIAPGTVACQDVFGARRLWRMDAKVEGIERVDTPAGTKDAYKVTTRFERKRHPTLSSTKRPRAEIDIYFSTDGTQTPLMFVVRSEGIEATGRLVRWSLEGNSEEREWGI